MKTFVVLLLLILMMAASATAQNLAQNITAEYRIGPPARTASPEQSIMFREDSSGQKREIPIDINKVMRGKKDDIAILPNDIVVVPNSKAKSRILPLINALGRGVAYSATRIVP